MMTSAEYLQSLRERIPKGSKYGNKRELVNGVVFDSRANRRYEEQLKLRIAAADDPLISYDREVKLPIIWPDGTLIAYYVADFICYYADGSRKIFDVKTKVTMTPSFRLKAKLIEAQYKEPVICLDSKTFQPIPLGRKKKPAKP